MWKELDIFSIDQVILSSSKDSNVVTLSNVNENQKYGHMWRLLWDTDVAHKEYFAWE